eukprot:9292954-Karenia_brevis.AAC.1
MERQRRLSTIKMKDAVKKLRKFMFEAEDRILELARTVRERPVLKKQSLFEQYAPHSNGGARGSAEPT